MQGQERSKISLPDSNCAYHLTGPVPCESCRARKKRCFHSRDDLRAVDSSVTVETSSGPQPSRDNSLRDFSPYLGCVGAYAAESVLEDISSADTMTMTGSNHTPQATSNDNPSSSDLQHVDLLSPADRATLTTKIQQGRRLWYHSHRQKLAIPVLSESYRCHLEDSGAFLVLPPSTTNVLLGIYISVLDDLIPIVDGPSLFRDISNGKGSRHLAKAICLVTSKFPHAAPHLRLEANGPLLKYRDFGSKLLASLDAAIRANLETDRLTKIRILALMHLYNDGPNCRERSSSYLSDAIGEAWAMALHHANYEDDPPDGASHRTACHMLWWTLRNFDRLNKIVMGVAPFMIDDSDIGIDRISPRKDNYRSSLMGISTTLGDLTATATKIHKASSREISDDNSPFPNFADITAGSSFAHFLKCHQEYLELWYHLASMMSCRYGRPGSITYNRRLKSADRVIAILCHKGHVDLPPLPLVPYVLSIAITVMFRAIKDGQRSVQVAISEVGQCCDALDELGQLWTGAKGIAILSRQSFSHITSLVPYSSQHVNTGQQLDHISGRPRLVRTYNIPDFSSRPTVESTEVAERNQQIQYWNSTESIHDALMDTNLGQGFTDLAFDMLKDMDSTGFFDHLNSIHDNSESVLGVNDLIA